MEKLTLVELQNLKYLISSQDIMFHKLNNYSSQSVDPQIKQLFTKSAQEILNAKQKLITFLN